MKKDIPSVGFGDLSGKSFPDVTTWKETAHRPGWGDLVRVTALLGTLALESFGHANTVATEGSSEPAATSEAVSVAEPFTFIHLAGGPGGPGSSDGAGRTAQFSLPSGVAVDDEGNVFVADSGNHSIRRVTPDGIVSTVAGAPGLVGSADGSGNAARFYSPTRLTVDGAGNLFVADTLNHTIRKVTRDGGVSTLAGLAGSVGTADGPGTLARFANPLGVAVDGSGNLYVSDAPLTGFWGVPGLVSNTIRKVSVAEGWVTTLAGSAGQSGSADGTGSQARFNYPSGVAVDDSGNLYVADIWNSAVRKIVVASGSVTTVAGLAGNPGSSDGDGLAARFYSPADVALDPWGSLFVADKFNHTIRKITLATGQVVTVAGAAGDSGDTDGIANAARFNQPAGIAVDRYGNIYVADAYNNAIRKGIPPWLSLVLSQSRVLITVDWQNQYSGERGTAYSLPQDDRFGFFYFFDKNNPEVFVKVLDFGAGSALCFVGGLTDFYYKVTFRVLRTGQTLVFEKPAGDYVGFVDNGTLQFSMAPDAPMASNAGTGGMTFVGTLSTSEAEQSAGEAAAEAFSAGIPQTLAATPQSLVFSSGRVSVNVDWRNQYSGETGRAFGLPKADQYGFFYYTDPNNPEVFVKVLDFGGGGALCFVGGLTDFYYKVTFTVVRTGQQLVFEKPAGEYIGFVDNGTLRF
ncbi:MAG TPA: NHL repeat-containing protein [Thermoanaerobaculia bacterium]|nr:NHL repeat-containing protein [Thermoanaerobaculia bacterium]HQR67699.1 NHL repeat-containing protein [Thermoanaerobaculia bacterium]